MNNFYSFCEENNIKITSCDKTKLTSFYYINCYYDDVSESLVYASTYYRLKELASIFNGEENNDNNDDEDAFMIFNTKDSEYKLITVKYNDTMSELTSFMFENKDNVKPYIFKTRDEAYKCKDLISKRCNGFITMSVIRVKDYMGHTSGWE